jgi:hypothetical protein
MHIPYVREVLLVLAVHANGILPFVDELENLVHWRGREGRWALGEASDELVEEVLGRHLEVHGVSAVLDERVNELWASVRTQSRGDGANI